MILGLDISTATIGLAIFNNEYKLYILSHISFKQKEKSLFKKLDSFIEWYKQYEDLEINYIFIEEPLKKFKGKFTNADVIQRLTQFNSLISGYLYRKYNIEPVYYNVQSARKIAFPNLKIPQEHPNKKYLVWDAVMHSEPQINWEYSNRIHQLKPENFDMSDAYVVAIAGIIDYIKK